MFKTCFNVGDMSNNCPPTDDELLECVWKNSASAAAMCAETKAVGGFKIDAWTKMLDHTTKASAAMHELNNRLRGVRAEPPQRNKPD